MLILLNSKSELNAIHLTFAQKLGFSIRSINKKAPKIDGTMLNIYRIIVAVFLVTDKANHIKFFKKIFLMANISPKIVFEVLFLTLSIVNVDFLNWEL